jgi:hypothetical protein
MDHRISNRSDFAVSFVTLKAAGHAKRGQFRTHGGSDAEPDEPVVRSLGLG